MNTKSEEPGPTETMSQTQPLSPQQNRLWLLQKESTGWPYRSWCSILLSGDVEAGRLEQAIESAVARHEILRTSFAWSGSSTPLQMIHGTCSLKLKRVNLSDFSDQAREDMSDEVLRQATPQALHKGHESLLQAVLIQLDARRFRLILTLPALCADSLSLDLLMCEIGRQYAGQAGNQPTRRPAQGTDAYNIELPKSTASDEKPKGPSLYWRQQARRTPISGRFPFEWARPRSGGFRPSSLANAFSPGQVERLRALAQENNADLRAVLLASWRILLQRLAGEQALGLGVQFSGQNQRPSRNALGLFSPFLPMPRTSGTDFLDVLRETHQVLKQHALHQQEFDWRDAYSAENTEHWAAGFAFECWPRDEPYANVNFQMEDKYSCSERFTIKMLIIEHPHQLRWQMHYDAERMRSDDAQRLAEAFETLLDGVLDDPRARILTLPVVGPCEQQQLQTELNRRADEVPPWRAVQDLIAEQAARRPESIAVVFRDEHLSYGELLRRSTRLADCLRSAGIQREVAVALFLERSLETVLSLLAVLQAGGSFVPIDTDLPWRRLRQLLTACRAQLVLTRRHLATAMLQPGAGVLCLDEDWEFDFPNRHPQQTFEARPENLAYSLFTSSPSARPRSVAIEHRQLSCFVQGFLADIEAKPMRWAMASSFATDSGYAALFAALCSGGTLNILPREDTRLGVALSDACRRGAFDAIKLTPSQIRLLLENHPTLPRELLISSGESCDWSLIERIRELHPTGQILNHYGPVETTIAGLSHRILGRDPRCATAPIGRPLPGYRVYVVDPGLRPVARWMSGEILLGGATARGYNGDPRSTAERFVPDPFSEEPGGRLFRTGDLALHAQDGSLEFLGRIDQQLKIDGRRVEPGEIEAVLTQHPAVQSAAVLLQGSADRPQLVAYVTAVKKSNLRTSQLRSFLSERLPESMIPSSIVTLRSLPINENGKLDRGALPHPAGGHVNPVPLDTTAPSNQVASG